MEKIYKCESAINSMRNLNNEIRYTAIKEKLTSENALRVFENFDLIVDATDNFEAR